MRGSWISDVIALRFELNRVNQSSLFVAVLLCLYAGSSTSCTWYSVLAIFSSFNRVPLSNWTISSGIRVPYSPFKMHTNTISSKYVCNEFVKFILWMLPYAKFIGKKKRIGFRFGFVFVSVLGLRLRSCRHFALHLSRFQLIFEHWIL